jgi:hypothetical protein
MKEADELLELVGDDLPEASFDETRFPCTLNLRIWDAGTRLLSTHISKQYPRICLMCLGRSSIAPIRYELASQRGQKSVDPNSVKTRDIDASVVVTILSSL